MREKSFVLTLVPVDFITSNVQICPDHCLLVEHAIEDLSLKLILDVQQLGEADEFVMAFRLAHQFGHLLLQQVRVHRPYLRNL